MEEEGFYEPEFVPEFGAFERGQVRRGGRGLSPTEIRDKNLSQLQKRVYQERLSGYEKLRKFLDIVFVKIDMSEDLKRNMKLSEKDQGNILQAAAVVQDPEYKNPLAFVLGYFVTKAGHAINNERLASSTRILTLLGQESENIDINDIIRYCRLWQNLQS